jgi:RNA polymerase sigma factor (sigma-70 family)
VLYLKGEKRALEELYNRYYKQLVSFFIRWKISNGFLEHDLCHDTWLKAIQLLNHGLFDFTGKFRFWIFNIAVHTKQSYFRWRRIHPSIHNSGEAHLLESTAQHHHLDFDWLMRMESVLTERERQVLNMHGRDGIPLNVIAKMLDIDESTSRNTFAHAREKMMEVLKQNGITGWTND